MWAHGTSPAKCCRNSAAVIAPAPGLDYGVQRLLMGSPEAACEAFEVLCVLPVQPSSQPPAVQTTAAVFAVAALALLPGLRRSTRWTLPPPSLHLLSISRT